MNAYGHRARGIELPQSRLTPEDVRLMRALYADGMSTSAIARKFGVHKATAHRAVTYETWRHVREDAA